MHQRLHDTPRAQEWLAQFAAHDRETALMLVDGVVMIDSAQFDRAIHRLVASEARSRLTQTPVALYATREVTQPSSSTNGAEPLRQERGLNSLADWKSRPHYFDPDVPTATPDASPGSVVGSEGVVAHLIRDIKHRQQEVKFLSHASIDQMRRTRCRRAFLIDDIIGSGGRSESFVECFCNHPTIRSWISGGFLRITVLAFGGTDRGISRVREHRFVENVRVDRPVAEGRKSWTFNQRESVATLCRKYAHLTKRPQWALGYESTFSLMVFQHDVPNTTPAILWAASPTWRPLFDQRPSLGHSTWPVQKDIDSRRAWVLAALGKRRAPFGWNFERHIKPQGVVSLAVLAAAARGIRNPAVISEIVELNLDEVAAILAECTRLGWLDAVGRLTSRGKDELEYVRQLGIDYKCRLPIKGDPYYPTSLRGQELI